MIASRRRLPVYILGRRLRNVRARFLYVWRIPHFFEFEDRVWRKIDTNITTCVSYHTNNCIDIRFLVQIVFLVVFGFSKSLNSQKFEVKCLYIFFALKQKRKEKV